MDHDGPVRLRGGRLGYTVPLGTAGTRGSVAYTHVASRAGEEFRDLDIQGAGDIVNLAITSNARGGPGIVLASVALDAGIINAPFFTSLVVTAVLTSQLAGWWLGYTLRRGLPLLSDSDLRRRGTTLEGILSEDANPVHAGSVVVAARSDHRA